MSPMVQQKVMLAYILAKFGHRFQTRKELDAAGNSLRYFEHVRRVALIVMDEAHCYNYDVVAAALLHE